MSSVSNEEEEEEETFYHAPLWANPANEEIPSVENLIQYPVEEDSIEPLSKKPRQF